LWRGCHVVLLISTNQGLTTKKARQRWWRSRKPLTCSPLEEAQWWNTEQGQRRASSGDHGRQAKAPKSQISMQSCLQWGHSSQSQRKRQHGSYSYLLVHQPVLSHGLEFLDIYWLIHLTHKELFLLNWVFLSLFISTKYT